MKAKRPRTRRTKLQERWRAAAKAVTRLHTLTLALGAERTNILDDPGLDAGVALERLAAIDAQAEKVPELRQALLARRTSSYRAYMQCLGTATQVEK